MKIKKRRKLTPKMIAFYERRRLYWKKKKIRGLIASKIKFIKEKFFLENMKIDELIFEIEELEGKAFCEKIASEKMKLNYSEIEDWSLEKRVAFFDKILSELNFQEQAEISLNDSIIYPIQGKYLLTA